MNVGKYVFSQIVEFVDYKAFDKCVNRYRGNYRTRGLSCWNQFLHLLFGQITWQNSIRSNTNAITRLNLCALYLKIDERKQPATKEFA